MNRLFTYIAAASGEATAVELVARESVDKSYEEDGMAVECIETIYRFSNGVTLQQCVESDVLQSTDAVCPECWISYAILSETGSTSIQQQIKTFTNICQEKFWLKINKQRLAP